MKLFLFGGAEIPLNQVEPLKKLIKDVILSLKTKFILHIPYARLISTEVEWYEGWFKEMMNDEGIKVLDARIDSEVDSAFNLPIFINGGIQRQNLIESVKKNTKLLNLISNAPNVIAESAGSMAMGEFMTADRSGDKIIKGLGILKNTIIEVHYSEKNRQQLLVQDMEKTGMKYGLGIDCATGIVIDPKEFPKKWSKIGNGNVDIKISK